MNPLLPAPEEAALSTPTTDALEPELNSPTTYPREPVRIAHAANMVKVHKRTIERRIQDGTLTGYRVGRCIYVDLAEVRQKLFVKIEPAGKGE